MKYLTTSLACGALVLLGGCSSIVNDSTHPVRIETLNSAGQNISGADCKLTNEYGNYLSKSGDTVLVRRSSQDLDIVCKQTDEQDARARAISRVNGGMFGNILFGGGVGAIIDHSKGTAYTYPTWIQLVFGQSLVFDRTNEQEGKPTPPNSPISEAQTPTTAQ